MGKNMKSKWRLKESCYFLFCLVFLCFTFYKVAENLLLLVNHSEVTAEVVKIERKHVKGGGYVIVTYNYEDDGVLMQDKLTLDSTIIRELKNIFLGEKIYVGQKLIVYRGGDGYSFVKDELVGEILRYCIYSIFIVFVMFILSDFRFLSKRKSKKLFYWQNNDFKIKEVSIKKIDESALFIGELENSKIICFGFLINGYFYEFTYADGIFYERCGQENVQKNREFADKSQLEKRIAELYRRACYK